MSSTLCKENGCGKKVWSKKGKIADNYCYYHIFCDANVCNTSKWVGPHRKPNGTHKCNKYRRDDTKFCRQHQLKMNQRELSLPREQVEESPHVFEGVDGVSVFNWI